MAGLGGQAEGGAGRAAWGAGGEGGVQALQGVFVPGWELWSPPPWFQSHFGRIASSGRCVGRVGGVQAGRPEGRRRPCGSAWVALSAAVELEGLRDLGGLGACTLEALPPSPLPSLSLRPRPLLCSAPLKGHPCPRPGVAWGPLEKSLGVWSEFLACLCGGHVLPLPLRKRGARALLMWPLRPAPPVQTGPAL